ncbi:UNVERIFIED_CONTAM: hypothetical protein HDU68_009152 [Siphonaria sp. JEL0065]|nr:hypothetical protein HDU68_009152 [Siphonaria sp. JEL0065]
MLKEKPAHVSNADFLASIATTFGQTRDQNSFNKDELIRAESNALNQRLLQQELEARVQISALTEELKTLKAKVFTDAVDPVGKAPATQTGKTPKKQKPATSTTASNSLILRFSKAAQAKAERACAALKTRDADLVKDIEFIESMKSLVDACGLPSLSEPQFRNIMGTVNRIMSSLHSKLKTAISDGNTDGSMSFGFTKTDTECHKLVLMIQAISRNCFELLSRTTIVSTRADFAILILRIMTQFLNLVSLITLESEKSALNCIPTQAVTLPPPPPPPPPQQQQDLSQAKLLITRDLRDEVCKIVSKAGLLVSSLSLVSVFSILKTCFRLMSRVSENLSVDAVNECIEDTMDVETKEVDHHRTTRFGRLKEEDLCYYLYALDDAVGVATSSIGKRLNSNVLDEKNDIELIGGSVINCF